jgi:hypothetical protein
LPGATKALVTGGIDSSTGKTILNVCNDKNSGPSDVTGGGAVGVKANSNQPGADSKTGAGGAPFPRDVNFPTTDDAAKSAFQADFKMGIKLQIQTLGIPDILPGDVVAVRGVGARFDWNYGVFVVRHFIGSSGFTTELELVSNTAAILASLVPAQGTVNTKEQQAAGKGAVATPEPVVAPGVTGGRGG